MNEWGWARVLEVRIESLERDLDFVKRSIRAARTMRRTIETRIGELTDELAALRFSPEKGDHDG